MENSSHGWKISSDSDDSKENYILFKVFQNAMNKIGKSKVPIESINYNFDEGGGELIVTDANGVSWTLEVNAKIKIPSELNNKQNARTSYTTCLFCCECDCNIKGYSENIEPICSICEYINKSK